MSAGDNTAIFDKAGALERVEDDFELFFELVEFFFEDYETATSSLAEAISASQHKAVEEQAHSIKSALGNIGAMKAHSLSFELEKLGREESIAAEQMEILNQLKESVEGYKTEVEALRSEKGM